MNLPRPVSVFCALLIVYFSAGSSQALVIYGGNGSGNTNDPSGGLPWGNAGSVGGASGVYLGNFETGSWVLSATHVTGGGAPGITLAGVFYAGVAGSGVQIRNGDNTTTDLALFRIASAPILPNLTLATSRPSSGEVATLIGNGGVEGTFKRWDVTTVAGTQNDVWTETASVSASDYVGYTVVGGIGKRWGQTLYFGSGYTFNVNGTGPTANVITSFDAISGSSLAVGGDSGSALFYSISGQFVLGGITSSLLSLGTPDTAPPGGAVATGKTFGTYYNLNGYADIVNYRDAILATVGSATPIPEPAAAAGVVGALVLLTGFAVRRRRITCR